MDDIFEELSENMDITEEDGKIKLNKKSYKEKEKKLFYIDPEIDQMLDYYKKKTGVSRSRLVELGLKYFFDRLEVKD